MRNVSIISVYSSYVYSNEYYISFTVLLRKQGQKPWKKCHHLLLQIWFDYNINLLITTFGRYCLEIFKGLIKKNKPPFRNHLKKLSIINPCTAFILIMLRKITVNLQTFRIYQKMASLYVWILVLYWCWVKCVCNSINEFTDLLVRDIIIFAYTMIFSAAL